ncbi:MAG: prolyl oligopeptidase family serine peptidase, partial [Leptospiraceae bacterium]|nr:prolyl oligopeptidase family serine peptidase [Leptospiraceae bacterium]
MRTFLIYIILLTLSIYGCRSQERKLKRIDKELQFVKTKLDGVNREYAFYSPYKPISNSPKIPLVLLLHGRFGTVSQVLEDNELLALAKKDKFFLLVPGGYSRSWADGRGTSPADKDKINDVRFIETLIINVSEKYNIDQKNIFITGHSNGGFMSHRMLLERTGLFKAGVIVAAHLSKSQLENFKPKQPVSIAFMLGTKDPLIPYEGGFIPKGAEILGGEETVQKWVNWNECGPESNLEAFDKEKDETKLE